MAIFAAGFVLGIAVCLIALRARDDIDGGHPL